MNDHAYFMQRALSLAAHGRFTAHPNPMVGCVIVNDGNIVGEGWHVRPGTPHAEVYALHQAGSLAAGADVYINLEPCSHFGRTPPCVDALIAAKVKRVIIPFTDPNPRVNGNGINQLQQAGIEVITGVEAKKAAALNRMFLHAMATRRAYVIAKWAMTLDGQLTLANPHQRWITSEDARNHTHLQRAQVGAILIGANTLRLDKPQLTARPPNIDPATIKHPRRIILSSHGNIDSSLLSKLPGETWVVSAKENSFSPYPSFAREEGNVTGKIHQLIMPHEKNPNRIDLQQLLTWLFEQECNSVLVEGGAHTLTAFFQEDLVDETHIYQALMHSGWVDKPALPFFVNQQNWTVHESQHFEQDIFIRATKHV
jgi:diaminohydroxyphosphoribosylaminopyrimidine deaminase/5-amino-6-(5-phosphoribosylamino)uracil reductase